MLSAILFVVAATAPAEIPTYDVKSLCVRQSTFMGSVTQSVLKQCYREQQTAYDTLKRIWTKVPEEIKAGSDTKARSKNASGGDGDYTILKYFVLRDMQERKDENHNKEFELQR